MFIHKAENFAAHCQCFIQLLVNKRLCFPQRRFLSMAISSGSQVQEEQSQAGLGSGLSALFSTQVLSP